MRKMFLAAAGALIGASALMTAGSSPANAGFCATSPDGGGNRACYPTYRQCARDIRGAGGTCVADYSGGGYGYDDSYAYAPGPVYGYGDGPGYYRRPGFGVYFGAY